MTRFLYIADTHLGANPMGYQQQRGYPAKLPEILTTLIEFLLPEHRVDFVLHGVEFVTVSSLVAPPSVQAV